MSVPEYAVFYTSVCFSYRGFRVRVMMLNATFNNSSVTSWLSVVLVHPEYTTDLPQVGFELTTLVVIGTDCINSCKSNYHSFTTPYRRLKKKERRRIQNWVSEWLLFNANSAIFQLYHGENKLIFNEMTMRSALY
jgi:hypothetical protein